MHLLPADFEFYKIDAGPVSEAECPALAARAVNVAEGISSSPATPVEGKRSGVGDRVVFIFTSGTTGLPKAVPLKGGDSIESRKSSWTYAPRWSQKFPTKSS